MFKELELGAIEDFFSSCLILSRIIAGAFGCLSMFSCAVVLIWKVFILGESCSCGTGALNLKGIFSCIFMACILFILLLRKLLKNWIFDARIEKCSIAFVENWFVLTDREEPHCCLVFVRIKGGCWNLTSGSLGNPDMKDEPRLAVSYSCVVVRMLTNRSRTRMCVCLEMLTPTV